MILEITLGTTCLALGFVVVKQRLLLKEASEVIKEYEEAVEVVESALISLIGKKLDKLSIKEVNKDEVVLTPTPAKKRRGRPVGSKNKTNDRRRKTSRS